MFDRRIEPGLRPAARQSRAGPPHAGRPSPGVRRSQGHPARRGHYLSVGAYQPTVSRPTRLWSGFS